MSESKIIDLQRARENRAPLPDSREMIGRFLSMTGSEALNRILDHEKPGRLVRSMTRVDLFWLIKKVGEEDSLPLLRLASEEQWQYILDMELWHRDRVGLNDAFEWLARLHNADPARLARFLFSHDGGMLASFYFYQSVQVFFKNEQEDTKIPEGFVSLDGMLFYRIMDKEREETIDGILRSMADEDYSRFQSLLVAIAGVIPSAIEEEMYRLKNVRLAEDGYLPFDEAIAVYSHEKAEHIRRDRSEYRLFYPEDEEERSMVPITPLVRTPDNNIFTGIVARIKDHLLLDRLRLEFAGLCNQIFSADGVRFDGIEVLERVCRKAGGYIHIGLEILSGNNLEIGEEFVRNNPLVSIFRVGFGRALEVKWEAERWIKGAWFMKKGFSSDFWGDSRGGTLKGIVMNKPRFFSGLMEEEEYRDFETLLEVEGCRRLIRQLVRLDALVEKITTQYVCDTDKLEDPHLTFHPIILNFWARTRLELEPGFISLSLEQMKEFFRLIRKNETTPPFSLEGFREAFIGDLRSVKEMELEPEDAALFEEALSGLWQEFCDEYAMVRIDDLDPRFTRFFYIRPLS